METNGEIDRQKRIGRQIDRWRDGGRERREERGKTSAFFFFAHPAPLPDLFSLHSEINPVKQAQSVDQRSSFLSSSEHGLSPGFLVLAAGNKSQEEEKN